jgi:3-oxoacyl-[acyl-carrier protein] reductase
MPSVIVTGGSRGLGLGIAERLMADGYDVIAVARRQSEPLAALMRGGGRTGAGVLAFRPFDLGDVAAIADFVRGLRREFGPIYGLVNNAALGTSGVLAMMPTARIDELVRLNLVSPIVVTRCVLRSMLAEPPGRPLGRIVNIASILGLGGYEGVSVYGATKAGLIGFTRSLAREVGPAGITVNAVAPGLLDTDMTRDYQELRGRVMRRAALRRLAEIGDVADVVAYLLGPRAKSITGTVVTVDAGSSL